jgi:hypothetical protein
LLHFSDSSNLQKKRQRNTTASKPLSYYPQLKFCAIFPAKAKKERVVKMATKTIKVSDLSGEDIRNEDRLARLVVEEHPDITDSVTLEVLPKEVERALPEEQNYVRFTYFPPTESGGAPQSFIMAVSDFNNLSQKEDMATVLQNALREQQEQAGRRRGRRGGRRAAAGQQRRQRKDFTSPEHAGEPHRGRITDAEKAYVRDNLREVNARLDREGYRTIDPNDPEMAERYGLHATRTAAMDSEMEE